MEAEDTMMSYIDLVLSLRHTHPDIMNTNTDVIDAIAQAQAEISFKVGQGDTNFIFQRGYKAGIREVVEWIDSKESVARPDKELRFAIYRDDWQAKLKEWEL